MGKHHLQMVVSFVLAGSLTACGGSGASVPGVVGATGAQNNVVTGTVSTNASNTNVAINAGGAANGNYIADADFNGGTIASSTSSIDTGRILSPAPQEVYQMQRYGPIIDYAIPDLTPNGACNVRLQFTESFFRTAGRRVFNIKINGGEVAANFDVFAAAGGANIAIVKTFHATADGGGNVTIQLVSSVNNASIAAVEVGPGSMTVATSPSPSPGHTVMTMNVGGSAAGSSRAHSAVNTSGSSFLSTERR
jgi:hypothetical protein